MKLYQTLEKQIKKEPNYISDNGEIKKWVVLNKAQNFDEELIGLLLEDPDLKAKFFIQVKEVWVFKQNLFIQFLEQKNYLNDSYTQFKNKVGLTIDGKHLKQRNEVSLVWPFKDCILEGGQSREEDKREEIFFNEVLAQDEITELLDPKVLTNAKRFDKDGEHHFAQFNRNEKGTITDNLIIKGNNLLALHSLKKEFAGKVKLIYIDPPYNTGNDGFQYNDNFNESSWLTFMKNRLEIARELLCKDGKIFVQCDDNEQAPLKILLDEVFKKQNFVETFVWKNTDNAPALSKKSRKNIEFIHCYEKMLDSKNYIGRESDNDDAPLLNSGNPITILEFQPQMIEFKISDGLYKKGSYDKVELINDLVVKNGKNENVIQIQGRFKWQQSFLDFEIMNGTYFIIKSNKFSIRYQRKYSSHLAPDKFLDGVYLSKALGIATNEDSKKHVDSLKINFDSFPKPESLISFLIKAVTEENDIILDYHLGSGTTASTAHKMNRQYIGIEQMDYIETVAVERLKKVIDGEQGGISKSVNWQGGGSFIYLELKKYNQTFIEKIEEAKDAKTLLQIWEEMKEKSFLNYNIDIQKQQQYIEDFKTLSLQEQKQHLCELLDKNQLYVNLSSLKDGNFACTPEEQRVTREFYQLKN
ncbi:site-specific DNA-methyltransferase [Chryseobacterium indologenes]|uniref:site-specific DNA-methyltransferase (adenine-specific) n=1 Tax=Chryseobacterium indologenes TaxID=253 RepID=A0AAD1DXG2_CHRID|nr:site-specific DNA-methyltransferase [Chryseobacterium indologenes]ASE60344.1 site-specific DNA-methyltransferase [Chryseobacterium indologenes]AZB20249.1 site-specific DNA-methyltransferase [Chryseobacterium indologenes]VFA44443.1 Modification methylase HindIII [Chryseobacterium indologenes]